MAKRPGSLRSKNSMQVAIQTQAQESDLPSLCACLQLRPVAQVLTRCTTVTQVAPVDPSDLSQFTISIPQGAKAFIKEAVEEYKLTNSVTADPKQPLEFWRVVRMRM